MVVNRGKKKTVETARSDRDVCAPDFPECYLDACHSAAPLAQFLTKALGLTW
jgi:hypothetical protein